MALFTIARSHAIKAEAVQGNADRRNGQRTTTLPKLLLAG
jgi:hypothetical protein